MRRARSVRAALFELLQWGSCEPRMPSSKLSSGLLAFNAQRKAGRSPKPWTRVVRETFYICNYSYCLSINRLEQI